MKRLLSIMLAMLVLTMNMSLTFSTHFCGGEAVKSSITLGLQELNCGMANMDGKTCDRHGHVQRINRKRCCENKYSTFSVDDDYSKPGIVSPNFDINFETTLVQTYRKNFIYFDKESNSFIAYSPPMIEQDRSVLFQLFRL